MMWKRGGLITANPVHSTVAHPRFQHRPGLIKRTHFMAGPGFSEACRAERMWITAQCSSTVLSRWLHLFWQALDCVWWWETAPGWRWAPVLQLTMWIMETRRSKRMHQQTPTPAVLILPSEVLTLRPQTYLIAARLQFEYDGWNVMEAMDPCALLTPVSTFYLSVVSSRNYSIRSLFHALMVYGCLNWVFYLVFSVRCILYLVSFPLNSIGTK